MQERSEATCHMAMPQCCYLAKGAKRPSHTTNIQTFLNKSSSNILAVTALKASNLNSAVWDQIFIFCCMNRPPANIPILLSEVEQEQRHSGNGDREAIVMGAGLCDGEGERAYTGYIPHIIRKVSANVFNLRRFGIFFFLKHPPPCFCLNVRNPVPCASCWGRRHTPVVCNELREPHTSHYPSGPVTKISTNKLLIPATIPVDW